MLAAVWPWGDRGVRAGAGFLEARWSQTSGLSCPPWRGARQRAVGLRLSSFLWEPFADDQGASCGRSSSPSASPRVRCLPPAESAVRGSSRRVPWPGLKRDNRGHTCVLVRSCLEEAGLSISALPWRTCEDGSVTVGVCPLPSGVASMLVPPQGSTSLRTEGLETDGCVLVFFI